MISNGLTKIINLSFAKQSLQLLSLTSQSITKIENLDFVNLKELYLSNNGITRIENLEKYCHRLFLSISDESFRCSKLEKLWLFSNKIQDIENLQSLKNLKELWLQDNLISQFDHVKTLPNLEVLALSANKISDRKALEVLTELPSLMELSFQDNDFKPCPITNITNYRNLLVHNLTQLQSLDGAPISEREKAVVNELHLQSIRDLNSKLDLIKKQNKEQIIQLNNKYV